MKRRIAIVLLLLVSGAIVNIAVAMWCAASSTVSLTVQPDSEERFSTVVDRLRWNSPLRIHFNDFESHRSLQLWHGHGRGITIKSVRAELEDNYSMYRTGPVKALHYVCTSAGWPFRSMQGEVDFYGRRGSPDVLLLRNGGIVEYTMSVQSPWDVEDDLGWWLQAKRPLPLRPLLPGFIINTLFYALLIWLLFIATFATRRMLRRRRGLCAKCAYPIGVSPVCTECGAAVTQNEPRA